jgi:hypothetical protein
MCVRAGFTKWTNSMLEPICSLAAAITVFLQSCDLDAESAQEEEKEDMFCSCAVLEVASLEICSLLFVCCACRAVVWMLSQHRRRE